MDEQAITELFLWFSTYQCMFIDQPMDEPMDEPMDNRLMYIRDDGQNMTQELPDFEIHGTFFAFNTVSLYNVLDVRSYNLTLDPTGHHKRRQLHQISAGLPKRTIVSLKHLHSGSSRLPPKIPRFHFPSLLTPSKGQLLFCF